MTRHFSIFRSPWQTLCLSRRVRYDCYFCWKAWPSSVASAVALCLSDLAGFDNANSLTMLHSGTCWATLHCYLSPQLPWSVRWTKCCDACYLLGTSSKCCASSKWTSSGTTRLGSSRHPADRPELDAFYLSTLCYWLDREQTCSWCCQRLSQQFQPCRPYENPKVCEPRRHDFL